MKEELEVLSVNMPLPSRLIKQEALYEEVQEQVTQQEELGVLFHKSPLSSRPIKQEMLNEVQQQEIPQEEIRVLLQKSPLSSRPIKQEMLNEVVQQQEIPQEELGVLFHKSPFSSRPIKQEMLNEDVQQQKVQQEDLAALLHKSPLSSRPIKQEMLNDYVEQQEIQQCDASTCSLSADVLLPTTFVSIDQLVDQIKQEPANADILTDPLASIQQDITLKMETLEPTPNNHLTNGSENSAVKKELETPRPASVMMNKSAVIQKWKEIFKGKLTIPRVDGTTSKTPKNIKTVTNRKTNRNTTEETSRTENSKSNGREATEKIYDYFKGKNKTPLSEKRHHDVKCLSDQKENGKTGKEPTVVNPMSNEKLLKKAYVRVVKLDIKWMESSAVYQSARGNKKNQVVTYAKEKNNGMNFDCDAENRQDGGKCTKSKERKILKESVAMGAIPNEMLLSKAYVPLVKVDNFLKDISPTNLRLNHYNFKPSKNADISEHKLRNGKLFNVKVSKKHVSHQLCKNGLESKSDMQGNNVCKKTKCKVCAKSFVSKLKLQEHSRTHRRSWSYKCNHCKAVFVYPATYKKHLLSHVITEHLRGLEDDMMHGEYKHLVKEQRYKINSFYKNMWKCQECSKSYKDFRDFLYHRETHKSNFEFKCELCPATFARRYHLNIHSQLHIKPFKCNKCDKSFQSNKSLVRHWYSHSRKHMLKCDKCNTHFKYLKVFEKHVLREHAVHFRCDVCEINFNFATSNEILEHKKLHT